MKRMFSWCFGEKILAELENNLIDNHLELCVNQLDLFQQGGRAVSSLVSLIHYWALKLILHYLCLVAMGYLPGLM